MGLIPCPVSFYYVPCMLQRQPEDKEDNEEDITMSFRFREIDILPPAIYNRYVASCLALWQVEDGRLYDGMVALRSGPLHVVVIRRDPGRITVSVKHKTDASKIDLNLVRSLRQFTGQTLQRIISLYNTDQKDGDESFFKIVGTMTMLSQEDLDQMVKRHVLPFNFYRQSKLNKYSSYVYNCIS